jgi:hypothetical protein
MSAKLEFGYLQDCFRLYFDLNKLAMRKVPNEIVDSDVSGLGSATRLVHELEDVGWPHVTAMTSDMSRHKGPKWVKRCFWVSLSPPAIRTLPPAGSHP